MSIYDDSSDDSTETEAEADEQAETDGEAGRDEPPAPEEPEPEEPAGEEVPIPDFGEDVSVREADDLEDDPAEEIEEDDVQEESDDLDDQDASDDGGSIGGWVTVAVVIAVLAFISNSTGRSSQPRTPHPYMR